MGPLFFALALTAGLQDAYGSSKADAEDPLVLAARVGARSAHDKIATSLLSDHIHVLQEDFKNFLSERLFLQIQHRGLNASEEHLDLMISQEAITRRTLTHLLAKSNLPGSPISLDLCFHHEDLAGAVLPYLCVRHEEEPFRLTHLGLHASVLSSLSQSPEVARALTQNSGLTSLRLYGLLNTCDFLALFPHLTHLDTSQVSLTEEAAGHLVARVQEFPFLRSFKAPNTQTHALALHLWQALGLCLETSAHLTALKQIENSFRSLLDQVPEELENTTKGF